MRRQIRQYFVKNFSMLLRINYEEARIEMEMENKMTSMQKREEMMRSVSRLFNTST